MLTLTAGRAGEALRDARADLAVAESSNAMPMLANAHLMLVLAALAARGSGLAHGHLPGNGPAPRTGQRHRHHRAEAYQAYRRCSSQLSMLLGIAPSAAAEALAATLRGG